MTYQADPYYIGGSLKLGTPPSGSENLPTGRMTNAQILAGYESATNSCTSEVKRTAHNELTFNIGNTLIVRYRDTDIVSVNGEGDIYLDTGGWNTPSTRRHVLNALKRLGYDATLTGKKDIRGICITIQDFTGQRGVFCRSRGVFRKERGVFESDLGYVQELGVDQ